MSTPEVVIHHSSEVLVQAAAARLITKIIDAQTSRGSASVVLTGGSTGIGLLERVRRSPAQEAVHWSAVDVYWGDERFLPAGHSDRNAVQAHEALLDHVPVDPARVHPMAPSDGKFSDSADEAAAHYAELLATTAEKATETPVPSFDVLLLGVGEEGHTASLFPNTPYVREQQRTVVGVHDCPKPPPTRLSLTLAAIQAACEVWVLTTGAGKAEAVAEALGGADPAEIPAAGARGHDRTLWLLDDAAAFHVPGLG